MAINYVDVSICRWHVVISIPMPHHCTRSLKTSRTMCGVLAVKRFMHPQPIISHTTDYNGITFFPNMLPLFLKKVMTTFTSMVLTVHFLYNMISQLNTTNYGIYNNFLQMIPIFHSMTNNCEKVMTNFFKRVFIKQISPVADGKSVFIATK